MFRIYSIFAARISLASFLIFAKTLSRSSKAKEDSNPIKERFCLVPQCAGGLPVSVEGQVFCTVQKMSKPPNKNREKACVCHSLF